MASETTNGKTTSYTYDDVGNILTITKDGTLVESYTYDILNQLTKVTQADGTIYEYTYDANGNLQEVKKDGTVTKSYTYGNDSGTDVTGGAMGCFFNILLDRGGGFRYNRSVRSLIGAER